MKYIEQIGFNKYLLVIWIKTRWNNGDVYEGEWKDGFSHGKGRFNQYSEHQKGDWYEGHFNQGLREGTKTFS